MSKPWSHHQLNHKFTLYYLDRSTLNIKKYHQSIEKIASFETIEEFWSIYLYLPRIGDLSNCDYLLFRDSIEPIWEDPHNSKGGQWKTHVYKAYSNRCWEKVMFPWIAGNLSTLDITGMVISTTNDEEVVLSVWNSSVGKANYLIKEKLAHLLSVNTRLEYEYVEKCLEYRVHNRPRHSSHSHSNTSNHSHTAVNASSHTPTGIVEVATSSSVITKPSSHNQLTIDPQIALSMAVAKANAKSAITVSTEHNPLPSHIIDTGVHDTIAPIMNPHLNHHRSHESGGGGGSGGSFMGLPQIPRNPIITAHTHDVSAGMGGVGIGVGVGIGGSGAGADAMYMAETVLSPASQSRHHHMNHGNVNVNVLSNTTTDPMVAGTAGGTAQYYQHNSGSAAVTTDPYTNAGSLATTHPYYSSPYDMATTVAAAASYQPQQQHSQQQQQHSHPQQQQHVHLQEHVHVQQVAGAAPVNVGNSAHQVYYGGQQQQQQQQQQHQQQPTTYGYHHGLEATMGYEQW